MEIDLFENDEAAKIAKEKLDEQLELDPLEADRGLQEKKSIGLKISSIRFGTMLSLKQSN